MAYKNREDQRKAHREWYRRNQAAAQARVHERKRELAAWIAEIKSSLCCSKCPENHSCCLEFHHRDRSQKEFEISAATRRGWSKERILKEIAKCDVLCSNCHKKLHYNERL